MPCYSHAHGVRSKVSVWPRRVKTVSGPFHTTGRLQMAKAWTAHVGLAVLLSAQTGAGSIAGTVKDATGAVLPGVTVEASSPALIEKVRTVVTDSEGQYKILDLPGGVYAVTFALTGFSTVKREGIELTDSFTA